MRHSCKLDIIGFLLCDFCKNPTFSRHFKPFLGNLTKANTA